MPRAIAPCSNQGLLASVALVLLLAVDVCAQDKAPPGSFASGGGPSVGSTYRTFATIGLPWSDPPGSDRALSGLIPLFARPRLLAAELLDFGTVVIDSSRSATLIITNIGGARLSINSITFASGSVDGPFSTLGSSLMLDPGEQDSIAIEFRPEAVGATFDTLVATTNDPFTTKWRVALRGSGSDAVVAAISVMPGDLDFEAVPADSSKSLQVVIRSAGGAPLEIQSFAVGDPTNFSISGLSTGSLSPGSADTALVMFHPTEPKRFTDELEIVTNATDSPTIVSLSGVLASQLTLTTPANGSLTVEQVVSAPDTTMSVIVSNSGATSLSWSAAVSPEAPWLGLNMASGTIDSLDTQRVDLDVSVKGLETGSYNTQILFRNDERPSNQSIVNVTLTVRNFEVALSAPSEVAFGNSILVRATAGTAVTSGVAFYRNGGAAMFDSVAMAIAGNQASATIPSSATGLRGVELYVQLRAGAAVETSPSEEFPRRVPVRVIDQDSPSMPLEQYRMISVPLSTNQASAPSILTDDLGPHGRDKWRLARWSSAQDDNLEHPANLGASLDAGNAFWLISRTADAFDVSGLSTFPALAETTFEIPLPGRSGAVSWTQIANPFAYLVQWDDCLIREPGGDVQTVAAAELAGLIEEELYEYVGLPDSEYAVVDVVEPWNGYLVNNISGGPLTLLVPARETEATNVQFRHAAAIARDGEMLLELRDGAEASDRVLVGRREDGRAGWDSQDRFAPPAPPGASSDLVLVNDAIPIRGELSADIRNVAYSVETWRLRMRFDEERERTLVIAGASSQSNDYAAYLVDLISGETTLLSDDQPVRIVPAPAERERELTIVAGPRALLVDQGYRPVDAVPVFSLLPAHPNPFREATVIHYRIPESGHVRMQIIDASGRLVKTLEDGRIDGGEHVIHWPGDDRYGRSVPSGTYFLRLGFGNRTLNSKIVHVR